MTRAYLALGSNIEPRLKYLQEAARWLGEQDGVRVVSRSRIYETQSVEGGGKGDFLNAALAVETSLSVRELLALCQHLEAQSGRERTGAHRAGPRALDVDILLFGDERHNLPDLEVPHPRALGRSFVLRPLLDVLEGGWLQPTPHGWSE
jgi:2-amino-4-hydroxy-6-hydroxymethyldihydropteridine diphosphokinase